MVPSGSAEPEPSKLTLCPVLAGFGEAVKEATGPWLLIVSVRLACAVLPSSSVTRSLTVTEPPVG